MCRKLDLLTESRRISANGPSYLRVPTNVRFADTVAKVENRAPLKISRKLIFRHLYCCDAL
jgi:hypothetical protein